MIFHLECSIQNLADVDRVELEDLFSRLVEADRFGRHFFVARRELCEWAVQQLELSGSVRAHLTSIREEYTERYALIGNSRAHTNVTLSLEDVSFDGRSTFCVGHRALLDGEYLWRSTSFVVEDGRTDAQLYEHLLGEVRLLCGGPSFCFDPVHGGGSGIVPTFDREVRRGRVVVCVVDQDRLAPMDRMSANAKAVIANYRKRNLDGWRQDACFIGSCLETIGRELENYIPYELLKLIPQYARYGDFDELDRITGRDEDAKSDDKFWLYFDVKEGLSGEKVLNKFAQSEI